MPVGGKGDTLHKYLNSSRNVTLVWRVPFLPGARCIYSSCRCSLSLWL